jgi:hypothetical protein
VLGYEGDARGSGAHNTLLLEVRDRAGAVETFGAYRFGSANTSRITRASSGPSHAFLRAELAGAYQSHIERRYDYDRVSRRLLWLKSDEGDRPDTIVLLDEIDVAEDAPTNLRRAQRFHLDSDPRIAGRTAVSLDSETSGIAVASLLPEAATLEVSDPVPGAEPGDYPGRYYTWRLDVVDPTGGRSSRMLTVVQAGDPAAFVSDAAEAVETDRSVSVALGGSTVAFVVGDVAVPLSLQVPPETRDVWVVGMDPDGDYGVSVDGDETGLTLGVSGGGSFRADAGGVLVFAIRDGAAVGL